MNNNFINKLTEGLVGESLIAEWFKYKGYDVLPVYEKEIDEGKGPRLFSLNKETIAPDMFVFNLKNAFFVEAKHKEAFSWYRKKEIWTTGIDLKHYEHYCNINDTTQFKVYLLFLHKGGQAKDSPPNSPSGLFGRSLDYLREHENHRSDRWGKSGMIYWNYEDLKLLETYENIISLTPKSCMTAVNI